MFIPNRHVFNVRIGAKWVIQFLELIMPAETLEHGMPDSERSLVLRCSRPGLGVPRFVVNDAGVDETRGD